MSRTSLIFRERNKPNCPVIGLRIDCSKLLSQHPHYNFAYLMPLRADLFASSSRMEPSVMFLQLSYAFAS